MAEGPEAVANLVLATLFGVAGVVGGYVFILAIQRGDEAAMWTAAAALLVGKAGTVSMMRADRQRKPRT